MYKVVDTYEGFYDVIGMFNTLSEAKFAAEQHCEDCDGECQITIYKGNKVVMYEVC